GQKATIGRPKGLSGSVCSGKRLGGEGIERTNPELWPTGGNAGNESQLAPVGRDGQETWSGIEESLLRRADSEPDCGCFCRSAAEVGNRCDDCRDDDGSCSDRPGETFLDLASRDSCTRYGWL